MSLHANKEKTRQNKGLVACTTHQSNLNMPRHVRSFVEAHFVKKFLFLETFFICMHIVMMRIDAIHVNLIKHSCKACARLKLSYSHQSALTHFM